MMITLLSRLHVGRAHGADLFTFLIDPTEEAYQRWWPGTHLAFHRLTSTPGHVGDVVHMDELIGARRVKLIGVVTAAEPGKRIVWQLKAGVRLPAWLTLTFDDDPAGVTITHEIRAGLRGVGRILDPLLRRYFSEAFARALDAHVRAEFPRLRDMLVLAERTDTRPVDRDAVEPGVRGVSDADPHLWSGGAWQPVRGPARGGRGHRCDFCWRRVDAVGVDRLASGRAAATQSGRR